jgi:hypothetical protein
MGKKLINCVLPGVLLTFTSPFRPTKELISEDFPTLDRPANAISGNEDIGNCFGSAAEIRNFAEVTFIVRAVQP